MRFVEFTPRRRTDLGRLNTATSTMINLDLVMEAVPNDGGTTLYLANGTTRFIEDSYEQVQAILTAQ